MPDLQLSAPAKLNLFLLITGRRPDGYHQLQTLFQLLDHGDRLDISLRKDGKIQLQGGPPGLPQEQNLVFRAARMLQTRFGAQAGADIELHKRLPAGGGLGGGSSDAATVLLGLNHLWNLHASREQLAEIGLHLGADVPLFVYGRTALATGIGEKLQPLEIAQKHYLVVHPGISVSTAEIFAHPELTRDSAAIKIAPPAEECARNDCQAVVRALYPEVAKAIEWLSSLGNARLTGTGACVFVELKQIADGEAYLASLPEGWTGFVAKGVNQSPLLSQIGPQQVEQH